MTRTRAGGPHAIGRRTRLPSSTAGYRSSRPTASRSWCSSTAAARQYLIAAGGVAEALPSARGGELVLLTAEMISATRVTVRLTATREMLDEIVDIPRRQWS